MDWLNCALFAFLILSTLLGGFVRVIARCFGEGAADGLIPIVVSAPLVVLLVEGAVGTLRPELSIAAALLLAWMALAYLVFLVRAAMDPFPDEDFPEPHCIPKKTFGRDIDYSNSQFAGIFSKLRVRFRCRPTDTNLHVSARAQRLRYWVFAITSTTIVHRHNVEILCDAKCDAGANGIGPLQAGGEDLRVQLLLAVQAASSHVRISARIYAAMGAPKVVFHAGGSAGSTSGSSVGLSAPVAPGVTGTAGATSGSSLNLNASVTVTFPDAAQVIEFDCGMFQWQCAPPDGEGTFLLDLGAVAPEEESEEEFGFSSEVEEPNEPVVCGRVFSIRATATGPTGSAAAGRAETRAYRAAQLACPGLCQNLQVVSWIPSVPVHHHGDVWSCSGVGEYICR